MSKKMLNESGVAGADRVKSRADFAQFLKDYEQILRKFPGFRGMKPSGSYNSNLAKQDFGDIDLIVHITSAKDKATVKKELQAFFTAMPDNVIVPFSSEKHAGKRTYNAGELVTVRYHNEQLGYSAQIDNIVALDPSEAGFKQQFLDMPAEKQGLILGLVKIATIETDPQAIFKSLGIRAPALTQPNEEYEFNLSSVEIQLRKITYKPGTYEQLGREVIWTSRNFDDLKKILYQYDLDADFDSLLAQAKATIKNPRSNARMQGVFASMITVKSGEVGTAKGAGKEQALAKIQQTFKEGRGIFRALLEAARPETVVFAFGRFQPPTIGHELLINKVKETAQRLGCPYYIYVSKKVGKTPAEKLKNPLSIEEKMPYLQKMFPGTNFVAASDLIRTPVEAAKALNEKYQNIVMVAGADRVPEFEQLLNAYNGKEYQYQSIEIVSSGERDPDSEGTEGMSGTKMRQAASDNDFETFRQGLPASLPEQDAMNLMNLVRTGLIKKPVKAVAEAGRGSNRGYIPGAPSPTAPELKGGRRSIDDESNMMYRYDSSVGRLKQVMVPNPRRQEAIGMGFRDTVEQALKLHNIIRSKFDPKKFVQKQGDKWVAVDPFGGISETKKSTTAQKLDRALQRGGFDSAASLQRIKDIEAKYKKPEEKKPQQGVAEGSEKHECPHCHGSGRMVRDPDIGTDQECFVCDGTGYVDDEQGVAEGKLKEIGHAASLDDSNFSTDSLLKAGKVIGQIENNDVMMASAGSETVYFLVVDNKVTAFLGFENGSLRNIKNFTDTPGVVRALLGYLIHKEGKKIKISRDEPPTPDGIKWITHLINSPRGLRITDTSGKPVDPVALKNEWETSKKSGAPGSTGIVIGENRVFGNKLRENEGKRSRPSLLMPVNMYDIPKKQGVAEGKVSGYKMYKNPDGTWYVENENEEVVLRNASQGEAEHMVWSGNEKLKKGVAEGEQPTKYRATVEYGPTAHDAHFVTVTATSTDEAYAKVEAWCKKNRVPNPMIIIRGADKPVDEDWQKVNKHDKTDGMSGKAVNAYRRENPGSKLKTAVTTKPSKLKAGSKDAKRRKSFCARMSGMKQAHASAKTKRDPDSPINKALRRWNCESVGDKEYRNWGEYEYEIKQKAGSALDYLHEINPDLFTRHGDEFMIDLAGKIAAQDPTASITQVAGGILRHLKTMYESKKIPVKAKQKDVGEGDIGKAIGGVAGAAVPVPGATLAGRAAGSYAGGKLGDKVGDMISLDKSKKDEAMLPKSAFAGSKKNKLGPAAHLKGSMKRPARQGDLVGGSAEESVQTVDVHAIHTEALREHLLSNLALYENADDVAAMRKFLDIHKTQPPSVNQSYVYASLQATPMANYVNVAHFNHEQELVKLDSNFVYFNIDGKIKRFPETGTLSGDALSQIFLFRSRKELDRFITMLKLKFSDYKYTSKILDEESIAREDKIKGVDGKACWKGKRYAGKVKKANGTYKDKCIPVSEDVENIMAHLIDKIIVNEVLGSNQLNELYSYQSDKNYLHQQPYKRYNIFVSKKKFNNLYFIAVAENPRNFEAVHKEKGNTQEEAVENLKKKIDQEIDVATKVSGNATIDFNVDFVKEILEMSSERFYAKIISGPSLVIAGPEVTEYPEILQSDGFKGSSIRTRNSPEGTTRLPAVPLSAKSAVASNLIANGRYVLGNETIDKDGNRVFELNFDSVVADPREKVRMRAPAITIGTNR